MRVIGDREFIFTVNVTRTSRGFAQENYGLIHDLSAITPSARWGDAGLPKAIFEFCRMKFESHRGPCRQHG